MKWLPLVLAGIFMVAQSIPPGPAGDDLARKTDLATVVADDNDFAFDLYAHLAKEEGNLFLSPASISTALAMTYAGARGQTADEMARTLHFTLDQQRLHPAFATVLRDWKAEGKKRAYQLTVANALWGQKGFAFVPEFLNTTRVHYGAGLIDVDFVSNAELARKTINEWVEKQTQDKIKQILQPGVLNTNTRLVLTNAIYFKGDWASQFKKDATRKEPFHVTARQTVDVPLMHQTESFPYLEADTFQMLELPYAGGDLSMAVLLPRQVDGLAALEKTLSEPRVKEWSAKLRKQKVAVTLPRFQLTRAFDLMQALTQLGMPLAFDQDGKSDFSGIGGSPGWLYLSAVIHKAFVDVNEQGTEAAAATAVVIAARAFIQVPTFRADRPFLFLIRDNRSGSILFLGRVTNPKA
jgi:serpin B